MRQPFPARPSVPRASRRAGPRGRLRAPAGRRWSRAAGGGLFCAMSLAYMTLLNKYSHTAQDGPPGARPIQLRMFYLPE